MSSLYANEHITTGLLLYWVDAIVCGTDGVTYKNECEMRVAACEKEQYIMVGSRGPCDLCQNVHCKHGARCEAGHCICAFDCPDAYDPVCGSDGTTYRNDCEMRRGSCQKGINLATVFFGECDRTPFRFLGRYFILFH
ncbi:hypothetical protein CEXT_428821 [Caerostris extrusa]|uniref:Kazal-like domain-containing protein n=1 Tax=Caerostris extrusa TaxID=172846 RepID=A0AAV4M3S3_CAEEX|nr:hypothetical protein CEXT_428821 [Caerostris extrusa]